MIGRNSARKSGKFKFKVDTHTNRDLSLLLSVFSGKDGKTAF